MKKFDWLTLFGWPALTAIILLSLLAGSSFWPGKSPPPTGPAAATDVKYAIGNGKKPIISEEIVEIRALYTPDLFASSRGNRLSTSQATTNRSDPRDIIPSGDPLFLAFPPPSNGTGTQWFAMTGRKTDNYEVDPRFWFHSPGQPSPRVKKPACNATRPAVATRQRCGRVRSIAGRHPKLSIELKGELKHFPVESEIFPDITLSAGQKPWAIQAEMRINSAGRVEHVFAESTDCEPPIYQEIIKRLYKWYFSDVTETCEGTIIISYPGYFAANSADSADLSKRQNIGSK